ncbi:DUF4291 domain-containing protein [Chitinophaga sp. Cy-1792]|uniref:DUF4291 domain-containing protein n=1 Tax=Chitinophaga sp. Cy-1792 TaxID=2608339 RepID=UPI0014215042|nr:DUF4291 domain-containing protein [Chitinophaga sp. Cy-1792]NIG55734.1 DUF4291 domain-containing protein [Chitinophaga sp. Cy-1792]
MLERQIRAVYDEETITVYQAYSPKIGILAVEHQRFIPPFKMDRMTWIKPSFLWMMYRAGWGTKEGQEHILAINIKRSGFEWAIGNACLSHYKPKLHGSESAWQEAMKQAPVRIQWDPEKDIHMQNLDYRSIQIGLSGIAVEHYVNDWVVSITDISDYSRDLHQLIRSGKKEEATAKLPQERIYPLDAALGKPIHHSTQQ